LTALSLQLLGITISPEIEARLLPCPPEGWARPPTKERAKLQVLINQEGRCKETDEKLGDIKNVRFDHRPPVWNRKYDPVANDTVPSVNDPNFIEAIASEIHDRRTFGRGGSTRGSDVGESSRHRRIEKKRTKRKHKYRWPNRPIAGRPMERSR
jgi:hypothetical protein